MPGMATIAADVFSISPTKRRIDVSAITRRRMSGSRIICSCNRIIVTSWLAAGMVMPGIAARAVVLAESGIFMPGMFAWEAATVSAIFMPGMFA